MVISHTTVGRLAHSSHSEANAFERGRDRIVRLIRRDRPDGGQKDAYDLEIDVGDEDVC